jgi:hypothetical protein
MKEGRMEEMKYYMTEDGTIDLNREGRGGGVAW